MNTLYVNLFAGPGAGKSTGAAYIFSQLKLVGVDCEYVSEYAKDLVWSQVDDQMHPEFEHQISIFAEQLKRLRRLQGKVPVVITDAPLALQHIYAEGETFLKLVDEEIAKFNNINVFINRVKPYNGNGRHQNEEQAKVIDTTLKSMFEMDGIVNGDTAGYDCIVNKIMRLI